MNRIIKHRKLHGLKSGPAPRWFQLDRGDALSDLLSMATGENERIHLCGNLEQMTREWMREPLAHGWTFGREFAFKHRTAIYQSPEDSWREVAVKLISHRESWLPGCEDISVADSAWKALQSEWRSTGLPLLSSPAATGKALLWESLPCDKDGKPVEFPALDDDLAKLVRANSPQHRIEVLHADNWKLAEADFVRLYQYDGRWMYAAMCGLDRLPVGAPKRAGGFVPYTPGIYDVTIRIPNGWQEWGGVGLIPLKREDGGWEYPAGGGRIFRTWAFEPELTLALKHDWEIFDFHDGYAFEKGRPLAAWSAKLIEMRAMLQRTAHSHVDGGIHVRNGYDFAAAAIRQILNHTIGAIHKNEYQREEFVSDLRYKEWRRRNPHLAEGDDVTRVEGGYMVPTFVQDTSQFSIFMPHWTSALYSLARARVAEWALKCDPATLVKIHGDAIYSTVEQPELDRLDDGKMLGRPRRKS